MKTIRFVLSCGLTSATLLHAQFKLPKVPKVPGASGGGATAGGSPIGGGGKVKAELDQAERALDGCDRHLKKDNPEGCATYHAKFEDSIGDAERALQGGSTAGAAAEYVTRINSLKARRDEQLKGMESSANKNAAVNATFTGEQAEKDKVAVEALRSFFKEFHGLNSTTAPREELIELAKQWARVKIDSERLLTAYPAPKSRQKVDESGHAMITAVRSLDADLKHASAEVDKSVREAIPRLLKFDLDQAESRLSTAEANGIVGSGLQAGRFLEGVENRLALYKLIAKDHPGFDAQLEPLTMAKHKEVSAHLEKFTEKIIAENEIPADDYSGADAAGIKEAARQAWMKHYPNLKILRIGLRGNWNRSMGWKWEDSRDSWYKFDNSRLSGFLILDTGSPKFVYLRPVNSYKDHLNGGNPDTRVGIWDPKEKPHPGDTYLRSKLK